MLHYLSDERTRGLRDEPEGKPFDIQRWMAYDRTHVAPTFFARPAWSLALARAFPFFQPWPLVLQLSTGERVFVPLMLRRGHLFSFRSLSGLPFGSYTLAVREDGTPASEHGATEAIERLLRTCSTMSINYWPLAPLHTGIRAKVTRRYETSLIDLSHGASHAIVNMDGRAVRNARAAMRRGVTCKQDCSSGNVDRYYSLLAAAAKRWESGTPTLSRDLIQAVMDFGGEDAEIWFSYYNGEIVAGGLLLYGSEEAFFWSAAMRREFGYLRPSNALNVALIERAAQRGMRWLNMGANEGLPGVAHFKKSLGATPLPYTTYTMQRSSVDAYQKIRSMIPFLGNA